MKNSIFLYFIIALAALASCKKDKTVFSETADERVGKVLAAYQDTLAHAPNGWKGFIFPGGLNGGVVAFYFKFNNANRVEMFSDFDSVSNVTVLQSSYRLKALQQPALIFDTYSYVSVLSDPDAAANGGSYGSGLTSDFEFAIDTIKGDTIMLTGRLHSTKAYLVKASQQEMNDYYNKKHTNRAFNNINKHLVYFKRVTFGGVTYEVVPNFDNRTVIITWVDGNGPHVVTTGYYYTTTGIAFITPIVSGSTTINGLDNIVWNNSALSMTLSVNGFNQTVATATRPLVIDATSPSRWWSSYARYLTNQGFHINGVDDALGIRNVTYFYGLSYESGGGTFLDAMGVYQLYNNQFHADYAPLFNPPTFTAGKAIFHYSRNFGNVSSTFTLSDSLTVDITRTQLTDALGYYLVQLGTTTYDMVGARDAKAWVRWYAN